MARWQEVADRLYVGRYDPFDVNVAVVGGADGLVVVDTRASARQGRELVADLRALPGPVLAVVNTHAHFDHCFGNQCFRAHRRYAHVRMPVQLAEREAPRLARTLAAAGPGSEEYADVEPTGPTDLVADRGRIDLGDRVVDLAHLGRGHTDNDLVVAVDGALLVGDLVEESAPPAYGADSFPLEWPGTVAAVLALAGPDSVVVPGHGAPVDRAYVVAQQAGLLAVAERIRRLHAAGVPEAEALAAGGADWPFPVDGLVDAVARGYAQCATPAHGTEPPDA